MAVINAVIGVDVGGTNTDAVIIDKSTNKPTIISKSKTPTTTDVTSGVKTAIHLALINAEEEDRKLAVQQVNIGTTHFMNALNEGKGLAKVAVIRLCGTASRKLPPFSDFPDRLTSSVRGSVFLINGGYQFDGSEITTLDEAEVVACVRKLKNTDQKNIAVCGIFSPIREQQEDLVVAVIQREFPEASVTASHLIGKFGLLERENATILNECLKPLCEKTTQGFQSALNDLGLKCPLYLTQHDGTIVSEYKALRYPVLCFASGATNSMLGAAHLSGNSNAIIVDIGGTSTNVGIILNGFPRETSGNVILAGIRINSRMPDLLSVGVGGGSYVHHRILDDGTHQIDIGPLSSGNMITSEGLVFCEDRQLSSRRLTALDAAVAAGIVQIGNKDNVKHLEKDMVTQVYVKIHNTLASLIDEMRLSDHELPLVLVGGGCVIVDKTMKFSGVSEIIVPDHYDVANAIGAAMGQISVYADQVFEFGQVGDKITSKMQHPRESVKQVVNPSENEMRTIHDSDNMSPLQVSKEEAMKCLLGDLRDEIISSGAMPESVSVVTMETYSLGTATRLNAKLVGVVKTDEEYEKYIVPNDVFKSEVSIGQQCHKQTISITGTNLTKARNNIAVTEPTIHAETGEWLISKYDIECLAVGAGILGCGGGGNPHIARLMALKALDAGQRIRVLTPSKFFENGGPENKLVFVVALMGAPTAVYERLVSGNETIGALECMLDLYKFGGYDDSVKKLRYNARNDDIKEEDGIVCIDNYQIGQDEKTSTRLYDGKEISALMSVEAAGFNCIAPLLAGAELDIPVLDCDGMGRAFPELQMFSPFIYGNRPYPATLADDKGRRAAVLYADGAKRLENHFRQTVVSMGCSAGVAMPFLNKDAIMKSTVPFSLSHAWRIGDTVMRARATNKSPVDAVVELENGKLVIYGKITYIIKETRDGFNVGNLKIEGLKEYHGTSVTIELKNELFICRKMSNGVDQVVACVPDLITIVDADTAQPIQTEELRLGIRVSVIAMCVHPAMSTDQAQKFVGPQAFGLGEDVQYQPLCDFKSVNIQPIGPK